MAALQTPEINFFRLYSICRFPLGPSVRGASENIAVLNICFDFLVVVASSSEKSYKFKRTPNVHFISFKVKHYVILCLLIKNLQISESHPNF